MSVFDEFKKYIPALFVAGEGVRIATNPTPEQQERINAVRDVKVSPYYDMAATTKNTMRPV